MTDICVFQCDNRNLSNNKLHLLNKEVNELQSEKLNINYRFEKFSSENPFVDKIKVLYNFMILHKNDIKIIIFLDSLDAYIYNSEKLLELLQTFEDSDANGVFSRDPNKEEVMVYGEKYKKSIEKEQTFVNSGSFIIKNNEYVRNMYTELLKEVKLNNKYVYVWPYDQYYISKYVARHKENFCILKFDEINSPDGKIIRHNWWKNNDLQLDLEYLKKELIQN
jgi:hypothetical protein